MSAALLFQFPETNAVSFFYIEDAFNNIWHLEGWDDYSDYSDEEYRRDMEEYAPDDPFEKWATAETDYSDKYNTEKADPKWWF